MEKIELSAEIRLTHIGGEADGGRIILDAPASENAKVKLLGDLMLHGKTFKVTIEDTKEITGPDHITETVKEE